METNTAILLTMIIPAGATVTNLVFRNNPNLRDGLTLAAAVATFLMVLTILSNVGNGTTEDLVMFEVFPGLDIAFNIEPLGLLFAIIASAYGSLRIYMASAICAVITRSTTHASSPVSRLPFRQ